MRAHWKPLLTLILLAPLLTELLSNNLPPAVFFSPRAFLFLTTVGYGFPLVLLREIACRHRVGLAGRCCLGLVYGIVNEGILAKTYFLAEKVPLPLFDHYGYVAGIAVPWALTITVWHACHALLYPVMIVDFFFPQHRAEPWLTRKAAVGLGVITSALASLIFFTRSPTRAPGLVPHFVLLLVTMGLLVWLAVKLPPASASEPARAFRWKPLGWGAAGFFGLFLAPLILAGARIPALTFCAGFALVLVVVLRWLIRHPSVSATDGLTFALGDEIMFVLFGSIAAIHQGSLTKLIVAGLFLLGFGLLLARVRKVRDSGQIPVDGA